MPKNKKLNPRPVLSPSGAEYSRNGFFNNGDLELHTNKTSFPQHHQNQHFYDANSLDVEEGELPTRFVAPIPDFDFDNGEFLEEQFANLFPDDASSFAENRSKNQWNNFISDDPLVVGQADFRLGIAGRRSVAFDGGQLVKKGGDLRREIQQKRKANDPNDLRNKLDSNRRHSCHEPYPQQVQNIPPEFLVTVSEEPPPFHHSNILSRISFPAPQPNAAVETSSIHSRLSRRTQSTNAASSAHSEKTTKPAQSSRGDVLSTSHLVKPIMEKATGQPKEAPKKPTRRKDESIAPNCREKPTESRKTRTTRLDDSEFRPSSLKRSPERVRRREPSNRPKRASPRRRSTVAYRMEERERSPRGLRGGRRERNARSRSPLSPVRDLRSPARYETRRRSPRDAERRRRRTRSPSLSPSAYRRTRGSPRPLEKYERARRSVSTNSDDLYARYRHKSLSLNLRVEDRERYESESPNRPRDLRHRDSRSFSTFDPSQDSYLDGDRTFSPQNRSVEERSDEGMESISDEEDEPEHRFFPENRQDGQRREMFPPDSPTGSLRPISRQEDFQGSPQPQLWLHQTPFCDQGQSGPRPVTGAPEWVRGHPQTGFPPGIDGHQLEAMRSELAMLGSMAQTVHGNNPYAPVLVDRLQAIHHNLAMAHLRQTLPSVVVPAKLQIQQSFRQPSNRMEEDKPRPIGKTDVSLSWRAEDRARMSQNPSGYFATSARNRNSEEPVKTELVGKVAEKNSRRQQLPIRSPPTNTTSDRTYSVKVETCSPPVELTENPAKKQGTAESLKTDRPKSEITGQIVPPKPNLPQTTKTVNSGKPAENKPQVPGRIQDPARTAASPKLPAKTVSPRRPNLVAIPADSDAHVSNSPRSSFKPRRVNKGDATIDGSLGATPPPYVLLPGFKAATPYGSVEERFLRDQEDPRAQWYLTGHGNDTGAMWNPEEPVAGSLERLVLPRPMSPGEPTSDREPEKPSRMGTDHTSLLRTNSQGIASSVLAGKNICEEGDSVDSVGKKAEGSRRC